MIFFINISVLTFDALAKILQNFLINGGIIHDSIFLVVIITISHIATETVVLTVNLKNNLGSGTIWSQHKIQCPPFSFLGRQNPSVFQKHPRLYKTGIFVDRLDKAAF